MDYWNNIDKSLGIICALYDEFIFIFLLGLMCCTIAIVPPWHLELRLDILDDCTGEATEIAKINPWLTYGEPLHRMREFGVTMKELDMLDETRCVGDQILAVVAAM